MYFANARTDSEALLKRPYVSWSFWELSSLEFGPDGMRVE